jgi:hypothetical protein
MYFVKTRNFQCSRFVQRLLNISLRFGVDGWPENDGDGKYHIETSSPIKAWTVWAYFMLLRPFSGGWTYIVRPSHALHATDYRAIY